MTENTTPNGKPPHKPNDIETKESLTGSAYTNVNNVGTHEQTLNGLHAQVQDMFGDEDDK